MVSDGEIVTSSHNHSMIILSNLHRPIGNTLVDDGGNEYPETVKLEGCHVNIRYKESVGLESLEVEVNTPLVGWAGDSGQPVVM